MAELNLTQEEIDERIAILRRFRKLLEEQRNKFREYLEVLEKQQSAIEKGDTEAMLAHTELEQQIVANIGSLQKVITPMEKLYESKSAQILGDGKSEEAKFIPHLKTDLIKLQQEVLMRNRQNCDLLRTNMAEMKNRMAMFRNPYKNSRSIYATDRTASLVNLQG
ncbi:MAG: flagellar biosynthesis protein FlgN [Spirochaetaceae bacterium]|nr:flagellar biosynthesis protein FlgN [Spirochaetaceae bacterium]